MWSHLEVFGGRLIFAFMKSKNKTNLTCETVVCCFHLAKFVSFIASNLLIAKVSGVCNCIPQQYNFIPIDVFFRLLHSLATPSARLLQCFNVMNFTSNVAFSTLTKWEVWRGVLVSVVGKQEVMQGKERKKTEDTFHTVSWGVLCWTWSTQRLLNNIGWPSPNYFEVGNSQIQPDFLREPSASCWLSLS